MALGISPNATVVEDSRVAGIAWERLRDPKPQVALQFYSSTGQDRIFYLGPHAPHLTAQEIDLLHGIWLELSSEVAPDEVHHHDVVHFALEEIQRELKDSGRENMANQLRMHLERIRSRRTATPGVG